MDLAHLFNACRTGDIETVKNLVEKRDVDLNVKDLWDSSPLYYACLCGHQELVRYLLENGAKCEANTFEGERCVYGALTNEIRKILVKEYGVISKKVMRRNDYDEMLRRAFEIGEFSDFQFNVHGHIFNAHRCILLARCDYFARMFRTRWKQKATVTLSHQLVHPEAFRVLLYFLYTGNLEFSIELMPHVSALLRQCQLYAIGEQLNQHLETLMALGRSKSKHKIVKITPKLLESQTFFKLYRTCDEQQIEQVEQEATNFADVIFKVSDRYFLCHKVFFCGRSDFFRALVYDHFLEAGDRSLPIFEINDISVEAFECLCCFAYTNSAEISLGVAISLIIKSDLYIFNSLKKYCSNIIGAHICELNAIDVIHLARSLCLPKLETTATEYIADNLGKYISTNEFRELAISDAKEIKERQETDTIGIIDDIRFFLSNFYHKDKDAKFELINRFLEDVGLGA